MNKYDELALVIASEIRVAIVRELNPTGKSYRQIELGVEEALQKDVSDGSLTWHLEKLKGGRVIEKREDELWYLTDVGIQISRILRLVDQALDVA
jgi:DNA-binding transcriptional ArsR family regulator